MTYTISQMSKLAQRHLGDDCGVVEKNGRVALRVGGSWGTPVKAHQLERIFRHISIRLCDGIGEHFEADVAAKIAELKSELAQGEAK